MVIELLSVHVHVLSVDNCFILQATEEPPFLTAGTEVSAKYRGAFCEAKVKKVTKIVKCKVSHVVDGIVFGKFSDAII